MEIREWGQWYRFLIPIPLGIDESEDRFLQRAQDCLEAFFDKYTKIPREKEVYPFEGHELESLKGEIDTWNFRTLELDGIDDCNVDFYVGTLEDNYLNHIGIDIIANANKPEREYMVDFLKIKWREFDYRF